VEGGLPRVQLNAPEPFLVVPVCFEMPPCLLTRQANA